jgi:hypothetical protein
MERLIEWRASVTDEQHRVVTKEADQANNGSKSESKCTSSDGPEPYITFFEARMKVHAKDASNHRDEAEGHGYDSDDKLHCKERIPLLVQLELRISLYIAR